ncbi:metallophosphoesterase family protein [Methanolapillus ohkumae]|uniref:Serine/threonine specific protein phosphatases domain-containing protein n=1 Tax=Methanolapillus ohkumae TaxID=3028298 RepID=A0AA96V7R5_9EURY|nr:hypothetical protein MsAm2_09860 [Methanosarcinaceae archaeon Am2]
MADDSGEKERLRRNLEQILPILQAEEAVFSLNAKKALIATDIHGNSDILDFILALGLEKKADAWIFLGDHIDKGPDSVGVLNRLFDLKIQSPKNVVLLRGNHETKDVNYLSEFKSSILEEPDLFELANDAFKELPVAVVLNEKVFCVHGGLSESPLLEISKSAEDSFSYLWSDPADVKGWSASPRGIRVKRFGPDVVQSFLQKNNFQLVIRGHTTLECGVKFWFDKTLVSLYSALPCAGPDIRAAVCLASPESVEFFFYRKDKKKNDNGFVWEYKTSRLALHPILKEKTAEQSGSENVMPAAPECKKRGKIRQKTDMEKWKRLTKKESAERKQKLRKNSKTTDSIQNTK